MNQETINDRELFMIDFDGQSNDPIAWKVPDELESIRVIRKRHYDDDMQTNKPSARSETSSESE